MVKVKCVKSNIMQKLDRMNIITQLKVYIHQNNFETTSTTALEQLPF